MFFMVPRNFPFGDLRSTSALSCGNCENGDTSPDEIYKSGRIGSIEDRICGQQQTTADIKKLVHGRVTHQFLMRYHCVSNQESSCAYPSNRIKPQVIVHASLIGLAPIQSYVPFLRQPLFECHHWLEQISLFFDARQRLVGTKP